MPSDIILSDVPTKYGNKSLIMRAIQPENVTWDDIFNFIENKTTMPRKFIVGSKSQMEDMFMGNITIIPHLII